MQFKPIFVSEKCRGTPWIQGKNIKFCCKSL